MIPFATLMAAICVWSLASALELGATDLAAKLLLTKVEYLGVVVVPLAWLAFALRYTGRLDRWGKRLVAFVAVEAATTAGLAWTNESHHWLWSSLGSDTTGGPFPALVVTHGWWFWVHAATDYVALLVGTVLLVQTILAASRLYRGQTAAVLLGALSPWVANAAYLLGVSPLANLDLTPFAFSLSGLALGWGLLRLGLLDIFIGLIPVARDAVVARMRDGVIVLDGHGHIVDLNPAAERILNCPTRSATGRTVEAILGGWPQLGTPARAETQAEATFGAGAAQRWYDVLRCALAARRQRTHSAPPADSWSCATSPTARRPKQLSATATSVIASSTPGDARIATYSWRRVGADFVLEDFNRAAEKITGGGIRTARGGLASERYATRPEILADLRACADGQRTLHREMPFSRDGGRPPGALPGGNVRLRSAGQCDGAHRGSDRASPGRVGAAPPGTARWPHRPAEPATAERPFGANAARSQTRVGVVGAAAPRPGSLQGHQRWARSSRRGCAAAADRTQADARAQRVDTHWPAWAATSSPCCCRAPTRRLLPLAARLLQALDRRSRLGGASVGGWREHRRGGVPRARQ